jgi:hypothetical protein
MHWYKQSLKIQTHEERNIINKKIALLKQYATMLNYLKKYVYQNAPDARNKLKGMIEDRTMSSFPKIIAVLKQIYAKALDNYAQFAQGCDAVLKKVYDQVKEMENDRSRFVNVDLPDRMKAFRERSKR